MSQSRRHRLAALFMAVCIAVLAVMPGLRVFAASRTVRVAVFELRGFFEKNRDGMPVGYGVDYLDKIAETTGWQYKYVWAENWDECVELLRTGRVDIISPAQITPERAQRYDFSSYSEGMECGALLALNTNEKLVYEDFESFDGMKTGCVESLIFKDGFLEYAKNNYFTPDIVYYRDTKAVMAALNAGEIDAAVVNLFAKTDTTKVLAKFDISPFHFMLNKERRVLLKELDEAMQIIKLDFPEFESGLMRRYYPAYSETPFTKSELEYIKQSPKLSVGYVANAAPVSYTDMETGEFGGITRRILDEISKISGLEFSYFAIPEGEITYRFLIDNNVDIISSVEHNKKNVGAGELRLSVPYLDATRIFVVNRELDFNTDAALRLAIVKGSMTLPAAIHETYPNFEILTYNTTAECLDAVRHGEADAVLQNQYVVTRLLAKPIYSHLTAIPVESFPDQMCLSPVLRDSGANAGLLSDPRLISILNKSIARVQDTQLSRIIVSETTDNQYQYCVGDFIYQFRASIFAAVVVAVFLIIFVNLLLITRRRTVQLVMENEAKLRSITNNINGGVVVLDASDELRIVYANEGFIELLQCGDDYDKIQNKAYKTYIHPDDTHKLKAIKELAVENNPQISIELRIMRGDKKYIPTLFNGTVSINAKKEREIYCVIMDISEQQALLNKLSLEQQKYNLLMENSGDIFMNIDCVKKSMSVSALFEKTFGHKMQGVISRNLPSDLLHALRVSDSDFAQAEKNVNQVFINKVPAEWESRIRKADGTFVWCRIFLYPMQARDGTLMEVFGKLLDVDDEIRTKRDLERRSRTDALTGLLNKAAFQEQAEHYLKSAGLGNTALMFIDIDYFKQINDVLGHMVGDRAIVDTAKKLQVIFSHYDLISRFGGDEFVILLKEIPVDTLMDKLAWTVEKLRCSYITEDGTVDATVSVGCVCTNGMPIKLEQMMEMADKALYSAKENGRNQFVMYSEDLK